MDAIVEIKHESLIRNWPHFVEWIDDKRRERRQRLALTQAANNWEKNDRPREGLLNSYQLHQFEQLTDLSNLENEFIDASSKAIERIQRKKQRILIASFGVLLTLIAGLWSFDHFYLQEKRRTSGELDILGSMTEGDRKRFAENRLDGVAIYLWNKKEKDPGALDKLVQILREADQQGLFESNAYQVTEWNVIENSSKVMYSIENEPTPTIITLEHPKGDGLHTKMLQMVWWEFSQSVWNDDFPISSKITINSREDRKTQFRMKFTQLNLPEMPQEINNDRSKFEGVLKKTEKKKETSGKTGQIIKYVSGMEARDLKLFTFDRSEVLLRDVGMDSPLKNLFGQYKSEWKAREAFKELNLPNWWWVPRWTIPIWKAVGYKEFYPPEVGAVVHAIMSIRKNPELIFTDGFVAGVLSWQEAVTPHTVRAACEAAGGISALIHETKSWLTKKNSLSQLKYFLEDEIKQRPTPAREECDLRRAWGAVSEEPSTAFFAKEVDVAMTGAFKPEVPLRVYIAENLRRYIAPTGILDEGVRSRIDDELRGYISRELGFSIPGVRITVDPKLNDGKFNIAFHGSFSHPFEVSPGHEVDDILKTIRKHVIRTRDVWIDLEETGKLINSLPLNINDWISKNYTSVELNLILKKTLSLRDSKNYDIEKLLQDGATLAHFSWLIRSLVFWKHVCKTSDDACLGDRLRETQQARMSQPIEGNVLSPSEATFPGIEFLLNNQFDEAAKKFNQRLSGSDRASAINMFLQGYGRVALQTEYREVEVACSPKPGQYSEHEDFVSVDSFRKKIIAFLDEYKHVLPEPMRRRIELCKISSESQQASVTSGLQKSLEHQFSLETAKWDPNEQYWLSYLALKTHLDSDAANGKAPPLLLKEIKKLLSESFRHLPLKEADLAFEEIIQFCVKPSAGAWCLQMLTDFPQLKPDSYWIPFQLAYVLSQLSRDNAYLALQLLDKAEGNLSRVEKTRRLEQKAWLEFIRGNVHNTLAYLGVEGDRDKAIQYFRGLTVAKMLGVKNGPGADLVYAALSQALHNKGELKEAEKAIDEGKKALEEYRSGNELAEELTLLDQQKITLLWSEGKFDEALKHLKGKSDKDSLYMRCQSRMFTPNQTDTEAMKTDIDAFLKTSHDYRDYIRLIYYWHLMRKGDKNSAIKLLEDRWKEINPSSWHARLMLERGDYMAVWREMLVGYYLGKIPKEDISERFENPDNFEASAFNNSGQSQQGFLCEWYFYDALFQSMNGDPSTRGSRLLIHLEKVISTSQKSFHEYSFAKDLITRIGKGEDLTYNYLPQNMGQVAN